MVLVLIPKVNGDFSTLTSLTKYSWILPGDDDGTEDIHAVLVVAVLRVGILIVMFEKRLVRSLTKILTVSVYNNKDRVN